MAKYKVAAVSVYKQDNISGTLVDLSAYVDTVGAIGRQFQSLDVTAFTNNAENIIAGIEQSQEWTVGGAFDDTATTGPDAVLAPLPGTKGSFEWYPAGTTSGRRKFSGECLCMYYRCQSEVKGLVRFEASFKLDGSGTVGTA